MGHGRRYCQVKTWCQFCITDTHATQACRKYKKNCERQSHSVKQKKHTGTGTRAESNCKSMRPTSTTIVPTSTYAMLQPDGDTAGANAQLTLQGEKRKSREHSRKSPQNQMKEVQTPMSEQLPHQRSCQDVCMDPSYQEPPQYAEINYHRPSPQRPVEVNKIGPTIQQSVIQHPVQRHTQPTEG